MAGLLDMFKGNESGGGLLARSGLSDPETRLAMGAAMMQGQTLGDQLGGAFGVLGQMRAANSKRNKTLEWLKRENPDLAQAVEAGAMDPMDAASTAYKMKLEAQAPRKPNFESVGGNLYNVDTGQWITPPQQSGDMPKRSLQPIYLDDGKGGVTIGQLDESGNLVASEMPNGMKPLSPYDKAFQGAQGREMGEFQGSQAATAQKDVSQADMALDLLDQIEQHPYLDRGVGGTSLFNAVPGTGGYDFQNLVDQAKGGAFLQAVQEMRGLGTLSNAEGQAATAAVTRMNTSTSKEAFLKAVSDYREIVSKSRDRALARTAPQIPQTQQSSVGSGGVDPETDALVRQYGGM